MSDVATRSITQDEAESHIYNNIGTTEVSEHRWYTKQLVVFEDADGALMGFYWLKPKTEMQEGMDEYEADPVPIYPVTAKEVTTTVYEVAS